KIGMDLRQSAESRPEFPGVSEAFPGIVIHHQRQARLGDELRIGLRRRLNHRHVPPSFLVSNASSSSRAIAYASRKASMRSSSLRIAWMTHTKRRAIFMAASWIFGSAA